MASVLVLQFPAEKAGWSAWVTEPSQNLAEVNSLMGKDAGPDSVLSCNLS